VRLQNPFSEDTRNLFLYEYNCWTCGRSDRGLEIHHSLGRCNNSPLNAYLTCPPCHSHYNHNQQEEARFLQKTIKWLLKQQYELTPKDIEFYQQNKHLYEMEL